MKQLLGIGFVLLFAVGGCKNRMADLTLVSTKNIDFSRMPTFVHGPERVTGEDKLQVILLFPTKKQVYMEEAVDNATESVPGAVALVDAVVYVTNWYIPWFYGETIITVEGTPLIDPARAAEQKVIAPGDGN